MLVKNDYDYYDCLIGMDGANIRYIERMTGHGRSEGKIFKMLEFVGIDRDVSDPSYTGDFVSTYEDVLAGCEGLLDYPGK